MEFCFQKSHNCIATAGQRQVGKFRTCLSITQTSDKTLKLMQQCCSLALSQCLLLQNNFCVEAQSQLTAFLDAASGFYAHLLDDLCSTFQINIPCRVKASKLVFLKGIYKCWLVSHKTELKVTCILLSLCSAVKCVVDYHCMLYILKMPAKCHLDDFLYSCPIMTYVVGIHFLAVVKIKCLDSMKYCTLVFTRTSLY